MTEFGKEFLPAAIEDAFDMSYIDCAIGVIVRVKS